MSDQGLTVLDLDQVVEVPVKLGGKEFKITQQKRALLEKVFGFVNSFKVDAEEETDFTKLMFKHYDASFPYIATILGHDGDADTIAHLQEHLHFSGAIQIFERYWEVNDLDAFLSRGGNPLLPKMLLESLETVKTES